MSKDTLFEDYPFTLGYYLTLQNDTNCGVLFPSFDKSITNLNNEADSNVSKIFTRCFKIIHKISEQYMIYKDKEVDIKIPWGIFYQ